MSKFTDLERQIIEYGNLRKQQRMEEAEKAFQKIRAAINGARSEKRSQEEGPYIIYYEDQDVRPEIFMGAGARIAAEQRYTTAKHQWACHLFAKVEPDPDIWEWPNPPMEKRNADER